jgi:drug/metabolite transporter (DMT)-like permease
MSATALGLVVLAALLHAVWNIAAKKAGGDDRFALISAVLVSVLWLPVALFVGLGEMRHWSWPQWSALTASAVLHVAYFTVLLTGYRRADLTVVYPTARGTAPLLSSLAAVVVLGEVLSPLGVAGVLGVCFGVFLVAGGVAMWRRARDGATHARTMAGLRWGAATGALIAAYTVVDGYSVKVLAITPVVVDYVGNVLRVPMLLPSALRDLPALRDSVRRQWPYALVVAALGPLAYILVLYAMRIAPLSHVAPARELSMLFAALLGGRLLGEGDRGMRTLGALCMAAGVAALALG